MRVGRPAAAGGGAELTHLGQRPGTAVAGGEEGLGSATTAATDGVEDSCNRRGPVSRRRRRGAHRHLGADNGCSGTTGGWAFVATRTRRCDERRAAACRARRRHGLREARAWRPPPQAGGAERASTTLAHRSLHRESPRPAREESGLKAGTKLRAAAGGEKRGDRHP
ncbi:hypothetical protein C2845_PM11G30460 [Panicum miliaceum]|uniref:Uncharacterized protein n=1 Tax=Panicum miliaceum TaxID=4540 RepID=A0A3L6RPL3_PANMI|nr:hypothetical protein C2845_PM11G30460 [Panicum miliaceum]